MKRRYVIVILIVVAVFALYFIPTPRHSFNELYKGNDTNVVTSLDSFRLLPLRSITAEGKQWNYLSTGSGKHSIIFLHGMAGGYDIWWQQINALKKNYRIISLTYPPANSLNEMGTAVIQILNNEKIDTTNVIGSSLGGYFAQYLKSTYPDRFSKAVLANTFPPNPIYKQKNQTAASIARFLPEWLVMKVFRGSIGANVIPAAENSPLAAAYLLEQSYGGMSKQQFLSRYNCVVDTFVPSFELTSSEDLLLIESDNDPLILPELRQKIKDLYPSAQKFTFHNKGHFPYLNQQEQYTKLISDFFRGTPK